MILGIGSDLMNSNRLRQSSDRLGMRLIRRIFTHDEIAHAERSMDPLRSYAKRWAAKEATLKALGTGLTKDISWRSIEIRSLISRQPVVHLTDGAEKHLASLTPAGRSAHLHLTMSDDGDWAQAFVMIELR